MNASDVGQVAVEREAFLLHRAAAPPPAAAPTGRRGIDPYSSLIFASVASGIDVARDDEDGVVRRVTIAGRTL